jgi:hypothetical protein
MTFDPDRRRPDTDDRYLERNYDGSGILPAILGVALLVVFGFVLLTSWSTTPTTTRESNVRTEAPVRTVPQEPPATVPKAPN